MTSATNYDNLVSELYVAYLGRPADYPGQQNFSAALANIAAPTDAAGLLALYNTNATVKSLVDAFGASAESQALYGNGSVESFVTAIYENLFNRPAEVAGLTFWVNAINSGQMTQGEVALAIAAGAQGTTTQGAADVQTLDAKLTVAQDFTSDLAQNPSLSAAYVGSAAAEEGRAFLQSINGGTSVILAQEAQQAANDLIASVVVLTGSVSIQSSGVATTVVSTATVSGTPFSANLGTGAATITIDGGTTATVTLGAHSAADAITLGASGTPTTAIAKFSGLNNAGSDTITFSVEQTGSVGGVQQGNTLTGFQQVTSANVAASGGNTTSLESWMAAAEGAAGSGVAGAAHSVAWFVFQGNTYLLESVAGQTADAGTMAANNTLVELTGTGYTFNHASGANGTLHLLG